MKAKVRVKQLLIVVRQPVSPLAMARICRVSEWRVKRFLRQWHTELRVERHAGDYWTWYKPNVKGPWR